MTAIFKAAVVQSGSVLFDTPATLVKLGTLTREAAGQGARLVVFPEAFVGGYPKGLGFGAHLGTRSPEGREEFRRYYDAAIDVPGPQALQIGEIARDNGVYLVVGVIERQGGTLYCSALTFGPDGTLLYKHRKLMPTALERLVWGFGDGSTIGVTQTPLGRMGSVICWENYMPLLRTAMYAQGIELYCAPTVDDREGWQSTMRHIATEGRCFVLSACQYLTRGDGPAEFHPMQGEAADTVLIRGGSCIFDPLGNVLAAPVYGEETILYAEIDRSSITRGKYDLDVTGHYGRPDIFALSVDTKPRPVVAFNNNSLHGEPASAPEGMPDVRIDRP